MVWNRKDFSVSDLSVLSENVDRIFLAISDDALEYFIQQHLHNYRGRIVHFSGALELSTAVSAHPLMTFGDQLYEFENYKKIPFVLTKPHQLQDLIPGLTNPYYQIEPEEKALYHATCVFSGNFTNLIWKEAFNQFHELGLPKEAIIPYLEQTFKNIKHAPNTSLTGPFARRDLKTIEKNLQSLALQNQKMKNIYSTFMETYL